MNGIQLKNSNDMENIWEKRRRKNTKIIQYKHMNAYIKAQLFALDCFSDNASSSSYITCNDIIRHKPHDNEEEGEEEGERRGDRKRGEGEILRCIWRNSQ